jgi:hypothetical protein
VGDDDEEFFCDAQGAREEGFCRGEDEPGDEVGEGWGNEEEDEEETAVGFEEGEGLGCAGLEAAQAEQHCRGGGGGGESGRNFEIRMRGELMKRWRSCHGTASLPKPNRFECSLPSSDRVLLFL